MSYHPSQSLARYPTYAMDAFGRVVPVGPPPPAALANVEPVRRENSALMKIAIGVIVVIIVLAIAYWLWQQQQAAARPVTRNRRPVSKQSTAEMARALFKRLEERGGVNETTMRSLQQLGRRS